MTYILFTRIRQTDFDETCGIRPNILKRKVYSFFKSIGIPIYLEVI